MNSHSDTAPEPVLLIIADISGYTRYMTANAKTLSHSQTIITELVKAIIRQIELPLEVAKLEGDAVFLFCRKQNGAQPWAVARKIIGGKLTAFFQMFREKVNELGASTTCTCHACTHIEKLRLKVVVHSGEALFHRVFNFLELAGVDVIIIHRLLKNSVAADQYLLLTEAARHEVEFSEAVKLNESQETYDDIGKIKTLVFLPDGETKMAVTPVISSFGVRFRRSWKLFCQLWFAPFASRPNEFHHIESGTTKFGRIVFATLTAPLTPLFLPVGSIFVLLHACKSPKIVQHHGPEHEHKAEVHAALESKLQIIQRGDRWTDRRAESKVHLLARLRR